MPHAIKDWCNLKAIKERSSRIEDSAKKQNEYQERRLSKYLIGIEKEHEGNMTMLRQQEKDLKRTEGKLTRQLQINRFKINRHRGSELGPHLSVSLPSISICEECDGSDIELKKKAVLEKIQREKTSWYDDKTSREQVFIRLLSFPDKTKKFAESLDGEQEMPLQDNEADPTSEGNLKLPPIKPEGRNWKRGIITANSLPTLE